MPGSLRVVQALYAYQPQAVDELQLAEDQLLFVVDESDPDWLQCTPIDAPQTTGAVPASYVDEPAALYAAVAVYDYAAVNDDELHVVEGQLLNVLAEVDDDWVLARAGVSESATYGLVPATYIERQAETSAILNNAQPITATSPAHRLSMASNNKSDIISTAPALSTIPAAAPSQLQQPSSSVKTSVSSGPPKIGTALYSFEVQEEGDLDIREGENCLVLDDSDPSWLQVKIVSSKKDRNGRIGIVSRDYIQLKEMGKSPALVSKSTLPVSIQVQPPQLPSQPDLDKRERQRIAEEQKERERVDALEKEREMAKEQEREAAKEREMVKEREREQERLQLQQQKVAETVSVIAHPPSLPTRPVLDIPVAAAVLPPKPSHPITPVASTAGGHSTTKPPVIRQWADKSGKFKVEAELVDFIDGQTVRILKTNGITIDVPVDSLSYEDVGFLFTHQGIPIPAHLRETSVKPAPMTSVIASKPPVVPSPGTRKLNIAADSTPQQHVHNGFNWYTFLTNLGISAADAATYAPKFVKERMDSTILPDLTRDVLKKEFGLAEGDVIRILKSVSASTRATTTTTATANQNDTTMLPGKMAEHEAKMAAQNLAKIDEFFATKAQRTEIEQANMAKNAQLAQDEQLARQLQQQEMRSAQGYGLNKSLSHSQNVSKSTASPPTIRRKGSTSAAGPTFDEIQQSMLAVNLARSSTPTAPPSKSRHPASNSTSNSNSLTLLTPATRVAPIESKAGAYTLSGSGSNAGRASNTASLLASSPAIPVVQPNRTLPAPLIPISNTHAPNSNSNAANASMFIPTVFTNNVSAQQQQYQQPMNMVPNQVSGGAALRMGMMPVQQMPQNLPVMGSTMNNQFNAIGNVNSGVLGVPQNTGMVTMSSMGRSANWQNATPDNPFGAGMTQPQMQAQTGMVRSHTQQHFQPSSQGGMQNPTGAPLDNLWSYHSADDLAGLAAGTGGNTAFGGPVARQNFGQQQPMMAPHGQMGQMGHPGMMTGQQLQQQQQYQQQLQIQQQQQLQLQQQQLQYGMGGGYTGGQRQW